MFGMPHEIVFIDTRGTKDLRSFTRTEGLDLVAQFETARVSPVRREPWPSTP